MDYELIETEIKNRLAAQIPDGAEIEVETMPETQAGFSRPVTTGRISVCYKGSKFGDPISTDETVQEETMTFELIVQATKLRGSKGIWAIGKLIRAVLLGWKSEQSGDRMTINAFDYTDYKENLWTYTMTFEMNALAVMAPEDAEETLLQWITIPDFMGEEITVPKEYGEGDVWKDEETWNDNRQIT